MPPARICQQERCTAREDSILMSASSLRVKNILGREKRRAPQVLRFTCPRCGRHEIAEAAPARAAA